MARKPKSLAGIEIKAVKGYQDTKGNFYPTYELALQASTENSLAEKVDRLMENFYSLLQTEGESGTFLLNDLSVTGPKTYVAVLQEIKTDLDFILEVSLRSKPQVTSKAKKAKATAGPVSSEEPKPKRKRRTKAEMEAARAAQAATPAPTAPGPATPQTPAAPKPPKPAAPAASSSEDDSVSWENMLPTDV